MKLIKSLILSISTYTILPMPFISIDQGEAGLVLGLFPLTGVIVAGVFYLSYILRTVFKVYIPFEAIFLLEAVIPVIVTGGIHMDGYMDTCDALGSNADRDKKLQILKDPHCGAFAVMGCVVYFILYIAALSLVRTRRQVLMVCIGFVLSRALSALALLTMPGTGNKGMAKSMVESSNRPVSLGLIYCFIALCVLGVFYLFGFIGVAALAIGLLFYFYYTFMAVRTFGGLTGDTAGWFLCIFELLFALLTGILGLFWYI